MKSDLQEKLWLIQDLKNQYYIGTQDAKQYIDESTEVEKRPKELCDLINAALPKDAKYPATPVRVFGACHYIENMLTFSPVFMNNDESDHERINLIKNIIFGVEMGDDFAKGDIRFMNETAWISMVFNRVEDRFVNDEFINTYSNEEYADKLKEWFLINNSNGPCDDKGLIRILTDNIVCCLEEEVENIDSVLLNSAVKAVEFEAARVLRNVNFFDEDTYEDVKASHKFGAFCMHIDEDSMIEMLEKDMLFHKLEYRRQVVASHASRCRTDSYDEIISGARKRLSMRRNAYEKNINNNMPDVILDENKKLIRNAESLIGLLVSEKRFIERYIAH